MNDNTARLIEQLAQKLGTTSEYLWSVLLKQAPIEATITLIQTGLVALFGLVLWCVHKKLSNTIVDNDYGKGNMYDKYELSAGVPMLLGLVIFVILSITAFFCFGEIINGYFNPEYWAFDHILRSLKPCK